MKKNLLILLLCLVQQGFTQSSPSFSSVLFQHPISDFYGLSSQNEFAMPFSEANNGIYLLEVSGSNCQNNTFKFVW